MASSAAGNSPANASALPADGNLPRAVGNGEVKVAGFGALSSHAATGEDAHRFSHMQWYLANARNQVHLIALVPGRLTREAFAGIVHQCLLRAPQLLHSEDVRNGTHQRAPSLSSGNGIPDHSELAKSGILSWQEVDELGTLPGDLYRLVDIPFEANRPAFRANCLVARNPGPDGIVSAIVFETVHSLIEGGDISAALRGHNAGHEHREAGSGGQTPL